MNPELAALQEIGRLVHQGELPAWVGAALAKSDPPVVCEARMVSGSYLQFLREQVGLDLSEQRTRDNRARLKGLAPHEGHVYFQVLIQQEGAVLCLGLLQRDLSLLYRIDG